MLDILFSKEKEEYSPDLSYWDVMTLFILVFGGIGIVIWTFIATWSIYFAVIVGIILCIIGFPALILTNNLDSKTNHYSKFEIKLYKFSVTYIKIVKYLLGLGIFFYFIYAIGKAIQTANSSQIIIFLLIIVITLLGIITYFLLNKRT